MRKIGVSLTVNFLREGKKFIAYSPTLDISTCGNSFEEAKKKFEELVDIFIDELVKMGTLESVLSECGWKKVPRPKPHWVPPAFITTTQEKFQIPIGA